MLSPNPSSELSCSTGVLSQMSSSMNLTRRICRSCSGAVRYDDNELDDTDFASLSTSSGRGRDSTDDDLGAGDCDVESSQSLRSARL